VLATLNQVAYSAQVTLGWDANSPSEKVHSYVIHFDLGLSGPPYDGAGSPVTVSVEELDDPDNPQYIINGLSNGETYSFALTTINEYGESGYSEAVSATIPTENSPPSNPTNSSPSDGAGGRSIDTVLGWTNGGGATSYDIYFGTDSSPDSSEFMGNQTSTSFNPGTLDYDTTYYWRIDASNSEGMTTGDVWSFTTASDQDSPPEVIVDNDGPGTSSTGGEWGYSSGLMPYGGTSRTEMRQGATYTFEASISGHHLVSLWWTYWRSRCTNVPVDIYDGSTLLDTVVVNHRENDGQWNPLGVYSFSSGTARVVVLSQSSGCSTCADAVKFVNQ